MEDTRRDAEARGDEVNMVPPAGEGTGMVAAVGTAPGATAQAAVRAEAERLACRADAFRLLGIFLRLPTAQVARGLAEGAVAADAREICAGLGLGEEANAMAKEACQLFGQARGADPDELLDELRCDYTRLFTNPEHPLVSVYEGVFKNTGDFDTSALTFVSPTALDAERRYREQGLWVDPQGNESADHMGAELDFACFLCEKAACQLRGGFCDEAHATRAALDGFRHAHLDKWGAAFFSLVAAQAATPAYRAVGRLGAALMGPAPAARTD